MEETNKRTHVLRMPRDFIHRAVTDPENHLIGYVRDILIDEVDWKLRFLHVTVGGHLGIGDKHFLIPIEAVERVSAGFVTIAQGREKVESAPELDPNILLQPDLRREIYDYYGYPVPA
jgi:PRC-barrel domain